MIANFESIHIDLWDIIEHENYIPLNDQLNEVPITSLTTELETLCCAPFLRKNIQRSIAIEVQNKCGTH